MVFQQGSWLPQSSAAPIGVFDSGVGGLTVLRELRRQLPHESILYVGDTARLPYGDRTPEEILQFVQEIMAWMMVQGVKMVVMACNTSSALALDAVQPVFPIPILGLIWPGARAAAQAGKRIGIIATPATVKSNAYLQAIQEANPDIRVWQVGCPQFVPLIEHNRVHEPATLAVAKTYLQPLLAVNIDTLVYGCTHYPHLEPLFRRFLPDAITRVDPAQYLVKAAAKELEVLNLSSTEPGRPTQFFVSGDPKQFADTAAPWLERPPHVSRVDFASVVPSRG